MKIVIVGLTVSSSWGNGHATLWRGLLGALVRRGCYPVFFEKDVPYYASTRDYDAIPGGKLVLYREWRDAGQALRRELADADAVMITSYCPDGIAATDLIADAARPLKLFYDLDTPVTLAALDRGQPLAYIGPGGLRAFDLVLSYTGGDALRQLRTKLGARKTATLYGHVDGAVHRKVAAVERYRADLSYLGTYASDRQAALEALFVAPARHCRDRRFLIGGAQYPPDFPWAENIFFVRHLPPDEHPAFYSSSRLTLSVTRRPMAALGWCPSGRLFEAAACGSAILSDYWPGLEEFFVPGEEILVAETPADTVAALDRGDAEIARIGARALQRVMAEHTSDRRADQLLAALETARAAPALSEAEA